MLNKLVCSEKNLKKSGYPRSLKFDLNALCFKIAINFSIYALYLVFTEH